MTTAIEQRKLIMAKFGRVSADIAVTNNNDVAFEWTTDNNGDPFPKGCRITGVAVIPHDAADPKVAASTIWRIRFYTKRTLLVDELVYEDTRFGDPTSSDPSFDKTEWEYHNEDGVEAINGTIGIENAATDCSFNIAIDFERI